MIGRIEYHYPRTLKCAGIFFFAFLVIPFTSNRFRAQSDLRLFGTVKSSQNGEVIPGATIAIMGSNHGAVANGEGRYSLQIPVGTPTKLRITAVGYRPDTLSVTLSITTQRDIQLLPVPIRSQTITITPQDSRAEGERIIREAIKAKETWVENLRTYRLQDYARLNVQNFSSPDSSVLSVLESEANGYWSKEKGYSEEITARRQTANLPPEINRVSVFRVVNFYDDRIKLAEYSLPGPIATDALSKYDFDLLGSGNVNGEETWTISMKPKNALIPGFTGTLWISKEDSSLVYLDLALADAVKLGPVQDTHISETFTLVQNSFWLPNELRFSLSTKFELPFLPTFHLEHVSIMQNYSVNDSLPDSLFTGELHRVALRADSTDSASWSRLRTPPLTQKEETAYHHIDSVAKLPPVEPKFDLITTAFDLILNPDLYLYNRVEGSRFELHGGFEQIGSWPLALDLLGAYGLGDQKFKYDLTLSQALLWTTRKGIEASYSSDGTMLAHTTDKIVPILTLSARVHSDLVRLGQSHSLFYNTLTALIAREDYPDYFWGKGIDATLLLQPRQNFSIAVAFRSETQSSIDTVVGHFSIFNHTVPYRANPSINDGKLNAASFTATFDEHWNGVSFYSQLEGELASKNFGGDFDYSKVGLHLAAELPAGGWGTSTIQLHFGEFLSGQPGIQHLFLFETPIDFAGGTTGFITTSAREFEGDKIFQAYLQQNFYDLPTRILGIHFLDPLSLQWFGIFNIGYSGVSPDRIPFLRGGVAPTGSTPFYEAGFGLGNIFNLLRFDLAWRLNHFIAGSKSAALRITFGFTI